MSAGGDPGVARLGGVARRLVWGAVICSALPVLAFLGALLYDAIEPLDDRHPVGMLIGALILYLAPVALVLLVLGLVAGALAWWLGRRDG